MTAGLPKLLNSLLERLPKGFFVLKFFLSICGLVIKKYMGGGDKKEGNILRIVLINSNYFTVGVKDKRILKVLMPVMLLVILDLGILPSVAAKSQNAIRTSKEMPNVGTKLL